MLFLSYNYLYISSSLYGRTQTSFIFIFLTAPTTMPGVQMIIKECGKVSIPYFIPMVLAPNPL